MKTYVVDMELIVHAEDHQSAVDMMANFMPEPTGTNEGVESWNPFRVSLCEGIGSWNISECRRVEDHKVIQEEFAK